MNNTSIAQIPLPFYSISTLHAWSSRVMDFFGISMNLLLFWLVWTKTPKEMRVHSRILFQTCIVDTIYICISLCVTPVLIYQRSVSVALLDGYLTRQVATFFNYDSWCIIVMYFIIVFCFLFEIYSISVQFVYRYLILNRNIKISLSRYLLMLTIPLVGALSMAGLNAWNIAQSTIGLNDELKTSFGSSIDWDNSVYIISTNNQTTYLFLSMLAMIITYSINITCGFKVVKFVRANTNINARMKALNQQLTKTLIILALFPLLVLLFLLAKTTLFMAAKLIGADIIEKILMYEQCVAFLFYNWIPVANPMVSIWNNRPYRDAVKKIFGKIPKTKTPVTTLVKPLTH